MNLIAAVDRGWGIGKGSGLLVSIPRDRKLFMTETMGKTVVMGRKTFESLPGKQPLYGRTNVVLSRDPSFSPKGVTVARSEEDALRILGGVPGSDIFICGGESIYRMFLRYCDTAHITALDYRYEADRFMPDLDRDPEWKLVLESEEETFFDVPYTFRKYVRII